MQPFRLLAKLAATFPFREDISDLRKANLQKLDSDNGKGLDKKYKDNPMKILEVHETTRQNGHGLGMWIVNNTIKMAKGEIKNIFGSDGFQITFTIGGV